MFTGIVEELGSVVALEPQGDAVRLRIRGPVVTGDAVHGASIAVNGVCLTVVGSGRDGAQTWFEVDAAAETLGMTTAKHWAKGTKLNLERALKIGDELGGHIVAGHADGIGKSAYSVVRREEMMCTVSYTPWCQLPPIASAASSLVAPAFTPKAADRLRPFMRQVVEELVDEVAPRGRCDLTVDVCEPYPIPIICELLGAPKSDWQLFSRWANDILEIFSLDVISKLDLIMRTQGELDEYTRGLIAARRDKPADDLLTDAAFTWGHGGNYVRLDPAAQVAHVLRIET